MGWKLVLCLFVGLAYATSNNSAWRPGAKYVYNVQSYTLTRHSSDYCTGIVIQAKLTITPKSDDVLVAMISDCQYAQYDDKVSNKCHLEEVPNHRQLSYQPLQLAQKPFRINLKNGVIKSISMYENLETHKVNVLRGIISEIQYDMQGENLVKNHLNQLPNNSFAGVFRTVEDTVSGKYETLYELAELPDFRTQGRPWMVPYPQLKGADGVIIEVVKTKDYSKSKQRVGYHYGLGNEENWEPFENRLGDFYTRTGMTRAIVTGTPNHYVIQSSVTSDIISASPLHTSEEKFYVSGVNNLTLLNFEPNAPQLQEQLSEQVYHHGIVYQYNSQYPTHNQHPSDWNRQQQNENDYQNNNEDTSSSEDSMSQENEWKQRRPQLQDAPDSPLLPFTVGYMGQPIKNNKNINISQVVKSLIGEIAKELQNPEANKQHDALANFLTLTSLIRSMDVKELQAVTNSLNGQGNDNYEWKAWHDALAEAGTGPAFLILQQLILENKMSSYMAGITVDQTMHSVRQPTEEYMRALFEFSKHQQVQAKESLKRKIIAGYANLVRKVYVNPDYAHEQYPTHSFGNFSTPSGIKFVSNKLVPYWADQLDHAIAQNDYSEAHVYISALGYLGHEDILHVFRPYYNGDKYATPHQRLQMVIALKTLATYNPDCVRPVLFKIYQNLADQEDVRVAAVYLLIQTEPSAFMFQRLGAYTNIDVSEQVSSATKSAIKAVADLQEPHFEKVRKNAQSALHLLNEKSYGIQYSKNYMRNYYIPEMNAAYMRVLKTIGSDDHFVPKFMKYSGISNIAGIKREQFKLGYMVNSVSQLMGALLRQSKSYHQYQNQHNQQNRGSDSKWSPNNIFRILNVHRPKPEPLEGNIFFKIEGIKTSYGFNEEDIELLPQVVQQMEQQLQSKDTFQFTKFINNHDMTISVATTTGMPAIYTFENPSLIHFHGKGSVVAEPKVSSQGVLQMPKQIKVDSQVRAIIQKKKQGQLGFFVPFNGKHYLAGYERQAQIEIALNVGVVGDIQNSQYSIDISPLDLQKSQQLLQFRSLPYIAIRDISKFQPIVNEQNIIKERKPYTFKHTFGQETMGMAFQAHFESDVKLNWAWFYNQIDRHDPVSLLAAPWFDDSVYYANLYVEHDWKQSSNDHVQVQIGTKRNEQYENTPNSGSFDISHLYKMPTNPEARQKQFYEKVSAGVSSSNVHVFDVQVKCMGKDEMSYFATAGLCTSNIDEKANFLFYGGRHSSAQHKAKPYKVAVLAKARIPKPNGLDPMFAVQSDYSANIEGQLAFGETEQSSAQINMHAIFEKTKEYKKKLQEHPLMSECKKEMKDGNYQLPACEELTIKASIIDHVSAKLQHQKVGKQFQNATVKFFEVLKYAFHEYYQQNVIDPSGGRKNEVDVDVQFHDDHRKVNVGIESEQSHMLFTDVEIHEFVHPLVTIHPVYSPKRRIVNYATRQSLLEASCAIDQTYANTLDNLTYPIDSLGEQWTVALLYAPGYANAEHGSNRFDSAHQSENQQVGSNRGERRYQKNPYQQQYQENQQQRDQQQWLQGEQQLQQGQHWLNRFRPSHLLQKYLPQNQQPHQQPQQPHSQQQWPEQQWPEHQYPEHSHKREQENVKHNPDNQIEHYAVLVRNRKGSKHEREVKITLQSRHTNYQPVEIDMIPSGSSKLKAEVLVNQKKQNISPQNSPAFNRYINMNVLPNGEVTVVVKDEFYVLYDGERFRLTIFNNNKFRNDVRGLCGTFNGDKRTDFSCPRNCILRDPAQFVAAYELSEQNQNQNKHDQHQCSFQEVIFADVVNDEHYGEHHQQEEITPTGHSVGCTRHQTRYFIDTDGKACFTVKMHPVCKPHCKPKQQITKSVGVYCVPSGKSTDLWIKEIQKGGSPDFSITSPTKSVPMQIDQSCTAHA